MRIRASLAVAALAVLAVAGCSSSDSGADGDAGGPLRVGVSPVPHAEILQYVADELAPARGLEIEVVEFTDYVQPNTALVDGSLDANYFQTVPYLDEFTASSGVELTWVAPVHVEPLGLYAEGITDIASLPDGASVALANDATNLARGLRLLAANDLITLAPGSESAATVSDVAENPRNLQFVELEAAQLPRSLSDTDASVINGNYAIDAGLSPADDALAVEEAEGNPNANGLVTRPELAQDPRITTLAELLTSAEVRAFIEENYAGEVVPSSAGS